MKITSASWYLIIVSFVFSGLNAQNQPFAMANDSYEIDPEVFSLIKGELETARKALIEIRDSQNPALAKQALSSFGGLIKELSYILGAVALGGGGVAGTGLIVNEIVGLKHFANQLGLGAVLVAAPFVIVAIIISYVFLKFLFGYLLAASEKDAHHIKDSLALIDQTINKLNYEIKKVERLMQQTQTNLVKA